MPSYQHDPNDPQSRMQHALWRVLRSLVFRGEPDSPLNDLPLSQLKCLHIVGEQEGQKMVDVAQRMEIKLPALSQIVDRLVKRGMLTRQPDPADRRVARLALTQQARAILADANAKRQARMTATAANLDDAAIDVVTEALSLLASAAEKVEAEERQSASQAPSKPDPLVEIITRRTSIRPRITVNEVSPPPVSGSQ